MKIAIGRCKGLPLAISIIGALNWRNDEEWQNYMKTIMHMDLNTEDIISDYDFNLYKAFKSSVNQLSDDNQTLFGLLAVFKTAKIPVQSIISLWSSQNIDQDVLPELKMLHQGSLL